jgi:glycosyltransferase involved in cell wall biosynthesis
MEFTFLQPPGGPSLGGGGAYITGLITGLREAGHDVAAATGTALPPHRVAIIDGPELGAFPPDALTNAVGLVHRLGPVATQPERERLQRLRRVVATNEAVAIRLAEEYGVPAERITAIPPGMPNVSRSTGSGGPHCAILSVGGLTTRKGHATLLRALARLRDLDWRLTIVGEEHRDPAYAAALRGQAETSGIAARVHFAGPLLHDALEVHWRAADLFALATESEGYGIAIAEALRRGLPVAVTAGGAAADLVSPEAGVVCPVGDSDGLSKAMRRLIFDTGLRTDMAQAAWMIGQTLPDWPAQAVRFAKAVM